MPTGMCMQPTQGMLLEHLVLVAREDCIFGLHRSEEIRKTVLDKLLPPGHCTDSRLRNISSLPMKRPIYLPCNFSLRGSLQDYHTTRG